MKNILFVIMLLTATLYGASVKKVKDEIDHVALAALLFKDGHTQRAGEELKKVDMEDKTVDFMLFYTLKALVATKEDLYKEANSYFLKAIEVGQSDKSIFLYMAQNAFKMQEYENTIKYLQDAGEIALQKASTYALMAESYWRLQKREKALGILAQAIEKFQNDYSFVKQRFNYYMSLELYQSAAEDAAFYTKHAALSEKDAILFVMALKKAKEIDRAIKLAEELNLKFDQSVELKVLLAHLYIEKGMIQTAADFFDKASIRDENFTKESSEMYRRAKKFVLSLYKNSQLLDAKEKLKQRVAIYLEYGEFEKITVSRSALERSGLLEDENIRYALAYAYYMNQDFDACEKELKKITKTDLFQKASELRKNIQKCKNDGWECDI